MTLYCVCRCKRSKNQVHHSFPKQDAIQRAKWIKFVKMCRKEWKGSPDKGKLCSDHFKAEDYNDHIMVKLGFKNKHKQLKERAIPSKYWKKSSDDKGAPIEVIVDPKDLDVGMEYPDNDVKIEKVEETKPVIKVEKKELKPDVLPVETLHGNQDNMPNVAHLHPNLSAVFSVVNLPVTNETICKSNPTQETSGVNTMLNPVNKNDSMTRLQDVPHKFTDHNEIIVKEEASSKLKVKPKVSVSVIQNVDSGNKLVNDQECSKVVYHCTSDEILYQDLASETCLSNQDASIIEENAQSEDRACENNSDQSVINNNINICTTSEKHVNERAHADIKRTQESLNQLEQQNFDFPCSSVNLVNEHEPIQKSDAIDSSRQVGIGSMISIYSQEDSASYFYHDVIEEIVGDESHIALPELIHDKAETRPNQDLYFDPELNVWMVEKERIDAQLRLESQTDSDTTVKPILLHFVSRTKTKSTKKSSKKSSKKSQNTIQINTNSPLETLDNCTLKTSVSQLNGLQVVPNINSNIEDFKNNENNDTELIKPNEDVDMVTSPSNHGNNDQVDCLVDESNVLNKSKSEHAYCKPASCDTKIKQKEKKTSQIQDGKEGRKKKTKKGKKKAPLNIINENTIKPAPKKKRKDIYNINEIIYDYDHLISDDEDDYVEDSPTEKKQKMAASDDEWLPSGVENMNQSCDESESQSDSEDFWDDLNYKLHGVCLNCGMFHSELKGPCPVQRISHVIENEESQSSDRSLPSGLYLVNAKNESDGIGIFADTDLEASTRLGPMTGEMIRYADISKSASMEHMWLVDKHFGPKTECLSMQDESKSNWLRNVRLDHTGFNYNLLKYVHDNKVYVVTAKHITAGTELILKAEDNILYKGNRVNLANISRKKHCELCDLDFSEEIYFKRHFYLLHYCLNHCKLYVCPRCKEFCFGYKAMRRHCWSEHPDFPVETRCVQCRLYFDTVAETKAHRAKVHPEKIQEKGSFRCNICNRLYDLKSSLKVHMVKAHEKAEKHQCKLCDKKFKRKRALGDHMKTHEGGEVKKVYCDKCGKACLDTSNLKVHMLTHSGVKPFKCQEKDCPIAYTTKQCLEKHYISAHKYTNKNMPAIFREVPFTFKACLGQE